ncbi:MAG: phenylalanine--tRNA ligase subunit alpha [Ignavibacteria bacterium]|nr:phenylalanine--tRNA ligase subunit alpha [Ignavibacteria bacterium]
MRPSRCIVRFSVPPPLFEGPLQDAITQLLDEVRARAGRLATRDDAEDFRIQYLARKGRIATLFEDMKALPPAERPVAGKLLNALRVEAEGIHAAAVASIGIAGAAHAAHLDLTLPGRAMPVGHQHIVTKTIDEIKTIFKAMGFSVATGPEIETDWYNFQALNFPPDHPARDMQDTFFIDDMRLLRTHTTPVQIRVMEQRTPPIRIIMPGRVFRNEVISARSHVQFHQVDGLFCDAHVTFADLKGTLVAFAKRYYGSALKYRFRPSFFPFTEPSAEMDITCYLCAGKGCRVCKQSGWLEILGCGMVDPNVFRAVGYDPDAVSGYAFGIGIERTAMLRHGVDDIRLLFENDLRVNRQFI